MWLKEREPPAPMLHLYLLALPFSFSTFIISPIFPFQGLSFFRFPLLKVFHFSHIQFSKSLISPISLLRFFHFSHFPFSKSFISPFQSLSVDSFICLIQFEIDAYYRISCGSFLKIKVSTSQLEVKSEIQDLLLSSKNVAAGLFSDLKVSTLKMWQQSS